MRFSKGKLGICLIVSLTLVLIVIHCIQLRTINIQKETIRLQKASIAVRDKAIVKQNAVIEIYERVYRDKKLIF